MSGSQRRRTRQRRVARPDDEATYDGVTDWAIYERDGWMCKMPECLCPDGREIAERRRIGLPDQTGDPWRASIDHIVPLASGGRDDAANKRAAHQRCNEGGQAHWGRARQPLSYTIGDVIGPARLQREVTL